MSPESPSGARSHARLALIAGLAMLLAGAALVVPQAAFAAPAAAPTLAQITQRVIDDTNAVRAETGLPALVRNADLDRVAANWAREQFENGAMSHNPNYSTQIPAGWQRAGENVGKGYTYTQIVPAWKASSSHYANIMRDYTSVGIGYYEQNGSRYWSQVFAKYPGVNQPAQTATGTTGAGAGSTGSTASPAAEPAAPAGVAVTLSSPSFENGLGSWSAPSGTIDGPNTQARGGSRSLLVPGASSRTITQSVSTAVEAGSTFTAVVWVRANASGSGTLTLRSVGGSGSREVARISFTATDSGWLRVPVSLTAKRAHTGFDLEIGTSTSGVTYRLDSVSLTRTGEPTAPAGSGSSAGTAPAPATGTQPATPSTTPAPAPSAPAPSPTPAAPAPSPTPSPAPTSRPLLDLGILRIGGRG